MRQCELLGLNRATLYYEAAPESEYNLALMALIDQIHTRLPFYGSRKITEQLWRDGYDVNRKRVQRLMRLMGIEALYPQKKPNLSAPGHKVFPYLLKDLEIVRPNQVWCADITYIRMRYGFLYLIAIMDWFSRYVLAWELSNSMEAGFCVAALQAALAEANPEIFNTDQGSQFSCDDFIKELQSRSILISMDGRGRAFDNIFIERLWRTVKYEEVYLKDYNDGFEARRSLRSYFKFYNSDRPHQSLGNCVPEEVYRKAA